jgi:microcystin-dependent protein
VNRFGTNTGQAAAANGQTCTLGQILLSASPSVTAGGVPANGQLMSINQNVALFSLLGTTYGGNGTSTFALPDLRGLAPNNMTYSICDQGIFPSRR